MDRLGDGCISWPQNHKIVLVLEPRKSGKVGYYFADHDKQVVLWPEDCDVSLDTKEVKVELKPSHIGKCSSNNSYFSHAHSWISRPPSSLLLLVIPFHSDHCPPLTYMTRKGATTSCFHMLTSSLLRCLRKSPTFWSMPLVVGAIPLFPNASYTLTFRVPEY